MLSAARRFSAVYAIVVLLVIHAGVAGAAGQSAWPPSAGAPAGSHHHLRRLVNPGFTVGYDTRLERPAWVAFRLKAIGHSTYMHRPAFVPDPRLPRSTQKLQYHGRHIDRGHMAPNYAMRQLYGRAAQRASFYYSNIVAQRSRLNQLDWQRLEEMEIDTIADHYAPLWVVAGPIGVNAAGQPQAFYRIWLARGRLGRWQALAFRLPQRVRGDERLSKYIVSIDAIEAATGLDFFPNLGAGVQRRIESRPAPAATFGFARLACSPARYADDWQNRGGIHLSYARCDGRVHSHAR